MEFDFFSLWFVYYPVSGILWFWHKVFGAVMGEDNGFAWTLSVIFLVFTLRALLIKPFIHQMRSMRKMQEFSPQIKKLQEKHKNDKPKLAEEMQKLQREHGVNPLGGCLPVLVQLPVFIGLFHVLRGFRSDYPYNYVFDKGGINSFLAGNIFGVRLDEAISGSLQTVGSFNLFNGGFNSHVVPVALPLMIVAAVATHFTARVSQQYQSAAAAANPQAAIMSKLTMWVFPAGVLLFGALLPIAILLYWLSNNTWTLTQQYLVFKKIHHEEQQKRAEAREQRDNLAPRPGQKPNRQRGDETSNGDGPVAADAGDTVAGDGTGGAAGADGVPVETSRNGGGQPAKGQPAGERDRGSGNPSPGKVGGTGAPKAASKGSGRTVPGKVGGKNGSGKNGSGKAGSGKAGSGKAGSGKKRR